jgi:oligopeptide transport system substrate-binding protein
MLTQIAAAFRKLHGGMLAIKCLSRFRARLPLHFARSLVTLVIAGVLGMMSMQPALAATLNIGNGPEPGSLDPHKATGAWEDRIIGELFEGLMAYSAEALAVPGQAESWTISPDGLTYTFALRPDARWSDGKPVVAENFVDGFQRLFDPTTAAVYAYLQFPIQNAEAISAGELPVDELGVTALDMLTLEITLEAPTPYFLEALAHFTAMPIRKDLIEKWGDRWTQPEHIVGNGPYRLVEWVPGSYLRGVQSDTYYDAARVAIDEVIWTNTSDLPAAFNRYRAGELDVLTEFPSEQYGFLEQNYPGEAHVQPFLGISFFLINFERPPFDDVRVREALSISLVREVIGRDVLGTGELPAFGWVPPGIANYDGTYRPAWADMSTRDRQDRARDLLAQAGYSEGKPLTLRLSLTTNDNQKRIGIAVADMWRKVGIETELYHTETVAHFNALAAGDFDVGNGGWFLDYNDASNTLDLLRGGLAGRDGVLDWGNNFGHFDNDRFDALMAEAGNTVDLVTRAHLMHEAEVIAMNDFAAVPLYWFVSKNVVSPKVTGFVDNVMDIHRVRWLVKHE